MLHHSEISRIDFKLGQIDHAYMKQEEMHQQNDESVGHGVAQVEAHAKCDSERERETCDTLAEFTTSVETTWQTLEGRFVWFPINQLACASILPGSCPTSTGQ